MDNCPYYIHNECYLYDLKADPKARDCGGFLPYNCFKGKDWCPYVGEITERDGIRMFVKHFAEMGYLFKEFRESLDEKIKKILKERGRRSR